MKKIDIDKLENKISTMDVPNNLSHLSERKIAQKIFKIKKFQKNIFYIGISILIVLVITGTFYLLQEKKVKHTGNVYNYHDNIVELSKANTYGTSRLNYMNGGRAVSYRDSFYVSCNDAVYEVSPTLETKIKHLDGDKTYLNVMDNVLYFINDQHKVQSYDMKMKKLTDLSISAKSLFVVGDYLFYIKNNDFSYLVQLNLKTRDYRSVSKSGCRYFYIQNDWIYYACQDGLYKVPLMTGETTQISKTTMKKMCIYQNIIYFLNDHGQIGRMKLDGSDEKILVKEETSDLFVREGYLYYTTSQGILRMNLENGDIKQLSTSKAQNIQIAGSWIYYTTKDSDDGFFTSLDENETRQWMVSAMTNKGG